MSKPKPTAKFAAPLVDENGVTVDVPPAGDPPYEPEPIDCCGEDENEGGLNGPSPLEDIAAMTEAAPPPVAGPVQERTILDWGTVKGHNPKPGAVARGHQHKGPHVLVVLTHLGGGNHRLWPANKLVSEAFYDESCEAAYGLPIR